MSGKKRPLFVSGGVCVLCDKMFDESDTTTLGLHGLWHERRGEAEGRKRPDGPTEWFASGTANDDVNA
jgi:hypothetical protein